MGRYYNGDIEGKFWFAVQSSTDASFFGGTESEPNYINYYFVEEDMDDINTGIVKCEETLGENKVKLDKFFNENNFYNDKTLAEYLEIDEVETKVLLEWYARLELGNKIKECVEKTGECFFEAEL